MKGGLSVKAVVNGAADFLPLGAFFITFRFAGFYAATAALMIAVMLSLVVSYLHTKCVPRFALIVGAFLVVFGTITLHFHHPRFMVFEYTISNLFFGILFLLAGIRNWKLLQWFFGSVLALTDDGWCRLAIRWGWCLIAVAVINEIVWAFGTLESWVYFRIVIAPLLTLYGFFLLYTVRNFHALGATRWGLRQ